MPPRAVRGVSYSTHMDRLRLYDYAASANCYKVRLLLAQLRLPYERVPIDIFAGDTLTDRYGLINPARETPVLEVGDGRLLPQSNAILIYLAEGSEFTPDDAFERARVLQWLFAEQTEVMMAIGGLRFRLLTGRLSPESEPAQARRKAALNALGLLERHLDDRDYFVADRYSIADIGLYGYVHVAPEAGLDLTPFPAVSRWLERVAAQADHMNDLQPYPPNASPGAGRSIYDS
jgi:glutathione S-transferase